MGTKNKSQKKKMEYGHLVDNEQILMATYQGNTA